MLNYLDSDATCVACLTISTADECKIEPLIC